MAVGDDQCDAAFWVTPRCFKLGSQPGSAIICSRATLPRTMPTLNRYHCWLPVVFKGLRKRRAQREYRSTMGTSNLKPTPRMLAAALLVDRRMAVSKKPGDSQDETERV
jgi:hypothetical protein